MELLEAIQKRHSVRSYSNRAIEEEKKSALKAKIEEINRESGLHIQLVTDEPKAFDGFMAHYGKFSGVRNYFALIGKKSDGLSEKCGYYGEKLVLLSQQLGLNTCWVAMTYSKVKSAYDTAPGEKLVIVIALGYGSTEGVQHKSKALSDVSKADSDEAWFKDGVKAALLAPTAMNQQKFHFEKKKDKVTATAGTGFYSKIDLGIAKLHFEIGSGKDSSVWS